MRIRGALELTLRQAESKQAAAEASASSATDEVGRLRTENSDLRSNLRAAELKEREFQTRAEETTSRLVQERELREEFKTTVRDTFTSLATTQLKTATDDLVDRTETLLKPARESLDKLEGQLRDLDVIGASVKDLNNLLQLPHLRGRFGEESLERLLEDFLPRSMYELQSAPAPGVSGRADAVIQFQTRRLPIDAKFPRERVEGLFDSTDAEKQEAAREEFVRVMKQEAKRISEYLAPESGTTDFAIMYLPSETLYMEAVRSAELGDYLHKLRVFPASPNTLMVTLKSIQMVFNMYEFAKTHQRATQELAKAQKVLVDFERKFNEAGVQLDKAQEAYSTARRHLTTYQRRVTDLADIEETESHSPPTPGADDDQSL